MAFNPLSDVLSILQQRPAWQTYHQYCLIKTHWSSVIPSKFSDKTRPVGLQSQVLWIATESAALAQHLALQRHTLLKKLNPLLSEPLKDIRFSSAHWATKPSSLTSESMDRDLTTKGLMLDQVSPSLTPEDAFQAWAKVIDERTQDLPSCPRCHCPTPPWELKRWSLCGYCAFHLP